MKFAWETSGESWVMHYTMCARGLYSKELSTDWSNCLLVYNIDLNNSKSWIRRFLQRWRAYKCTKVPNYIWQCSFACCPSNSDETPFNLYPLYRNEFLTEIHFHTKAWNRIEILLIESIFLLLKVDMNIFWLEKVGMIHELWEGVEDSWDWSILVREGKENKSDSLSSGERNGRRPTSKESELRHGDLLFRCDITP